MSISYFLKPQILGPVAFVPLGFAAGRIVKPIPSAVSYIIAGVFGAQVGWALGPWAHCNDPLLNEKYVCSLVLVSSLFLSKIFRFPHLVFCICTAALVQKIYLVIKKREDLLKKETLKSFLELRDHLRKGDMEGFKALFNKSFSNNVEYGHRELDALVGRGLPAIGWKLSGVTILHYAASEGNLDAIRFLHRHKSDLEARAGPLGCTRIGYTPLFISVYSCRVDAVRLLLELGANPKSKVCCEHTPLHAAASGLCYPSTHEAAIEIIEIMLAAGVDKGALDINKETAFGIASKFEAKLGEEKFERLRQLLA